MRDPRFRVTVVAVVVAVALLGLSLWSFDAARMAQRSARCRRMADELKQLEQRCREIVAMDPALRARMDDEAWDDPYLHDPILAERMILYCAEVREILLQASEKPREALPPLPQQP